MSKPGCKPYKWVKAPEGHPYATKKGLIQQHRLVAEQIVGRYLKPEEVVHHKDENTLNNDVSNLMVFATASDHASYHGGLPIYEKDNVWRAIRILQYQICPVCGKEFVVKYDNQYICSKACVGVLTSERMKRGIKPEELQDMLYDANGNFSSLARKLGVSGNALVKKLKCAGLPYHSADYRLCF